MPKLNSANATSVLPGSTRLRFALLGSQRMPEELPNVLAHYETIYIGSEPIRKEVITSFLNVGSKFGLKENALYCCYGMAEATLIVSGHRFESLATCFDESSQTKVIACMGKPASGMEVMIQDEGDQNGNGSILIRGKSLFSGYDGISNYQKEWFDTGDVGYQIEGVNYVIGRVSDSAVVNGLNIHAVDVENLLLNEVQIRSCLVIADQEKIYILIVPRNEEKLEKSEVSQKVFKAFGVFPTAIYQLPANEIPKTTSGKPMRHLVLSRLDYYEKWRICE